MIYIENEHFMMIITNCQEKDKRANVVCSEVVTERVRVGHGLEFDTYLWLYQTKAASNSSSYIGHVLVTYLMVTYLMEFPCYSVIATFTIEQCDNLLSFICEYQHMYYWNITDIICLLLF